MKFEVIKRSHVKRNIKIGVIIVLILSAIILTFTRAKYKITKSLPLVNGTINYELSDFNLIGAYIQTEGDNYTQVDEIPTSGYEFNSEKSYCTVNDENINVTLSYDMETQNLTITPLTTKGTKCYLYFDEKLSAGDTILASGNAPTGQTTDWTNNGQGVTYYYTGANPNNWVQFGEFWWRIIRINGDGSIRMIYQGTSANTTGTGTQIGTSAFNSSYNRSYYVGLVHDGSSQHGYGQPSTIMTTLNNWYNSNLASYEEDYIDTGAGFCSDRNLQSGSWSATGSHDYAAYGRLYNKGSESASLQCSDVDILSQDNGRLPNPIGLVTADEVQCSDVDILSQDNGRLPNPIGLVTADEVALAGVTWSNPQSSYLNTGQNYWTMSPSMSINGFAGVFRVYSSGRLIDDRVNYSNGVRPVINLKANIAISSGNGSSDTPFVVLTS